MQFVGVDTLYSGLGKAFPHLGNSFYIRAFKRWLEKTGNGRVAISDLRLAEDVIALQKMGAIIVRLERPDSGPVDSHISESGVYDIVNFDIVVRNDGSIETLHEKLETDVMALLQQQEPANKDHACTACRQRLRN